MFKHIIDQSDIFQDTRAYFEESASCFCPLEVLCLALSKVFDLDIELNCLQFIKKQCNHFSSIFKLKTFYKIFKSKIFWQSPC